LVTTLQTTSSGTADSTASISLPIPLSVFPAQRFQRFPEMKLVMKFKTHCPQLTPAIALYVVRTMFRYIPLS